MSLKSFHLLISGHVQGVGFRAYTLKKSKEYPLKGWVRNLVDGRVEILLTCDDGQIKTLVNDLYIGPPASEVDEIDIKELKTVETFESFTMLPTAQDEWEKE